MKDNNQGSSDIIQILLDILEHDRKNVMILVVICFAVPTFTLSKIRVFECPVLLRLALLISLISFIVSGFSFFTYTRRIHQKRLEGIQNIIDLDHNSLRETMFGTKTGVWAGASKYYNYGKNSLLAASIFYIIFFILFLFKKEIFV